MSLIIGKLLLNWVLYIIYSLNLCYISFNFGNQFFYRNHLHVIFMLYHIISCIAYFENLKLD